MRVHSILVMLVLMMGYIWMWVIMIWRGKSLLHVITIVGRFLIIVIWSVKIEEVWPCHCCIVDCC